MQLKFKFQIKAFLTLGLGNPFIKMRLTPNLQISFFNVGSLIGFIYKRRLLQLPGICQPIQDIFENRYFQIGID